MPRQFGLTRVVGREGIEPPVSIDGCFTGSCAPWRDRPNSGADWTAPVLMPLQLSRIWCPDWRSGALHARKESNPRPSVLETAAPPWLEPEWLEHAQDGVRAWSEGVRWWGAV